MEAGSGNLTLTCTVRELISGFTNTPSAHWSTASGPVTSGDDIVLTETLRNATHSAVALTFSSLHTSHAGQYTCQGLLVSPAAENNITSTPANVSVNVRCKYCGVHLWCVLTQYFHTVPAPAASVGVPSGPLYEGTSQTLTCSVTLPDAVDTNVTVAVDWTLDSTPITPSDRVVVPLASGVMSPFISTLRLRPLVMTDAGQYSCQATAHSSSSSHYITDSSHGNITEETLTVTGNVQHCGPVH